MKIRQKLSKPPESEEISTMVKYAKNVIEEFRRAKHYKNILSMVDCVFLITYEWNYWTNSFKMNYWS